ncbi:MAG TPA: thiamine pyrophosphate-binding protein [Nannocystaceae bacterium]|nr:thiamine pyrophosphate-binding protein [Nannocystaceae bacterium]
MAHAEQTTAERIAAWLEDRGVRHAFGVGGANIEDLFVAVQARRPRMQAVLGKHEHSAGSAADAYARVRGGVGVVMTTSGGGAMNLVSALAESFASRVPVLAIVGEPPTVLQGAGAFQDTSGRAGTVDAAAVFAAVSRWCERAIDPARVLAQLDAAWSAALAQRGPAVLLIAKDVQQAICSARIEPARSVDAPADDAAIARAAALLGGDRCLVIAGDQVVRSGARDRLARLVARIDARVAVTPDARDAFDNHDPRFLGVAGAMGHDAVLRGLAEARACLLVGTRMPILARQGLEAALRERPIAWIGDEPPHVVARESLHVGSDPNACLRALAEVLPQVQPRTVPPRADERAHDTFDTAAVLAAVARTLPSDGVVLVDAGSTGASAAHHLAIPRDARWLLAMGMAGMGWCFGAAIGAAFASGRRCTVVAGDGAFFMHGLELHTAVEHALPITYVILDNRAHGMCLVRERLLLHTDAGYNDFHRSRIGTGLAAMFPRMSAIDCTDIDALERALQRAATCPGPAVVCAQLPAVEVPPFQQFEQLSPGLATVARGAAREDD